MRTKNNRDFISNGLRLIDRINYRFTSEDNKIHAKPFFTI